jgi:hypothetical protein
MLSQLPLVSLLQLIQKRDASGRTPLHLACFSGSLPRVKKLFQCLAITSDGGLLGLLPSAVTARQKQDHELIIDASSKTLSLAKCPPEWQWPQQHQGAAESALSHHHNCPHSPHHDGAIAATTATSTTGMLSGNAALIAAVICAGDDDHATPLHTAARGGHASIAQILVHALMDLPGRGGINAATAAANSCDRWGKSPLSLACDAGHEDVVAVLLDVPRINMSSLVVHAWGPSMPLSGTATACNATSNKHWSAVLDMMSMVRYDG